MARISFRVFRGLFGYVSSAVIGPVVTASSETVRSEILESMNLGLPNQITVPNAGQRFGFAGKSRVGLSPRPGLAEFRRSSPHKPITWI